MEADPGLGGTEDIELPLRNQTPSTLAPVETPDDDSDGEKDVIFHDALSRLIGSTDDLESCRSCRPQCNHCGQSLRAAQENVQIS